MDYLLTFEDGSSAHLSHYGVKGMKWGVWNEETKDRYAGGHRKITPRDDIVSRINTGKPADRSDVSIVKNAAQIAKHKDMFARKAFPMTPDEDMAAINPFFEEGLEDHYSPDLNRVDHLKALTNCATCSVIYDLRRRGYDLDANMTENMSYFAGDIGYYYNNAEMNLSKNLDEVDKKLGKEPDGARGVLLGVTVSGGGHAIAWEKENGRIVYRDCQSGDKYDSKTISNLFSNALTKRYQNAFMTCRLDDKMPNLDKMYQHGLVSKSGKDSGKDYAGDKARNVAGTYALGLRRVEQGEKKLDDFGVSGISQYVAKAVGDVTSTYKRYDNNRKN